MSIARGVYTVRKRFPPSPSENTQQILERITLQMASSLDLQLVLTTITQGLIEELDAAFSRIWLLGPGDRCGDCFKAASCTNRDHCLHLMASAGLSPNLNGEYRRVPLGTMKIGKIAQEAIAICTNDVMEDDRIPNKQWLNDNGLRSFAGYPLVFRGDLLGVIAMFSRSPLSDKDFERLAIFANQAAVAIKNAQLFTEVEQLKNRLQAENVYLREEIELDHNFEEIIGESSAIKQVLKQVGIVAPTDSTVLLLGETGTGKELLARAVHDRSKRRERTFVKLNCAAIPTGLLESELFGHERGAFTGAIATKVGRFELADGGTLFLDEVGDIPLELQSKLLRVLQEQEFERLGSTKTIKVSVRLIAATNRDLPEMVANKLFRSDLYYRLNVFPIVSPSLRDRAGDIPLLIRYFTQRLARRMERRIERIPSDAMETLCRYRWPGNVRELENLVERAVILSQGTDLCVPLGELKTTAPDDPQPLTTLQAAERSHILHALGKTNWVISGPSGAAALLGMKRSTLQSRMVKLGISRRS